MTLLGNLKKAAMYGCLFFTTHDRALHSTKISSTFAASFYRYLCITAHTGK